MISISTRPILCLHVHAFSNTSILSHCRCRCVVVASSPLSLSSLSPQLLVFFFIVWSHIFPACVLLSAPLFLSPLLLSSLCALALLRNAFSRFQLDFSIGVVVVVLRCFVSVLLGLLCWFVVLLLQLGLGKGLCSALSQFCWWLIRHNSFSLSPFSSPGCRLLLCLPSRLDACMLLAWIMHGVADGPRA